MRLDAETFNSLYAGYAARVQGFFLRMTGYDRMLAQDLTQELFTRLWERRHQFNPDGSFSTWMFSAAYNMCKNRYRHLDVVAEYNDEYIATHKEAGQDDADTVADRMARVNAAVQSLPDEQKHVVLLRYYEGLSIKETAQVLGMPEGTVKSRAWTALTAIKEKMKRQKDY